MSIIIPTIVPTTTGDLAADRLLSEAAQHMTRAKHWHESMLDTRRIITEMKSQGDTPQAALFRQEDRQFRHTTIEQNAAVLCQQAALVRLLTLGRAGGGFGL